MVNTEKLSYGNCFTGAIMLMIKLKTWKIKIKHNKEWVFPSIHFYVLDKKGNKWHFTFAENIESKYFAIPFNFDSFIFKGKYARYIETKNDNFEIAELSGPGQVQTYRWADIVSWHIENNE